MPEAPIRILHLSDLHLRAGMAWDADPVLRALARFIADEVRAGLTPDLVCVTGDLAFAGKAADYALVQTWLEKSLWPALSSGLPDSLPRDRLLLVPGNHDADRDTVDFIAEATRAALLAAADQDQIATVLASHGQREVLLRRHNAYLDLYGDWLGEPQPLPWWQRVVDIRGRRIHCAGLDSAWIACGDTDRGSLLIGRYQVHQTVMHADAEGADWRLALIHHPWDYLAELDDREARPAIHLHRDLLLRGHLHETETYRVVPPDPARACLELAAGCVYESSRYPNAFQWIELHPDTREVRVLFRTWVHGAWQVDRNQPGCPDGTASFILATDSSIAPSKATEPPTADPTKYLSDLWDDTAYIDIRGLATGRPEAHRFPIGDLYIELKASGAATAPGPRAGRADDDQLPTARQETRLRQSLTEPRLVIVGDPGCGKTTFLRWVAHGLAADRLGRDPGAGSRHLGLEPRPGGPRLPILVSIADWLAYIAEARARHDGPALRKGADWLPDYLAARAADADQGLAHGDFRQWLRAGEAMILLDGLDEAPDRRRRKDAVALIEAVVRAWPDCPIAVTSRPAAYRDDLVIGGFTHTRIESLDAAAIDGFLSRWSAALFPEHPDKARAHHRALAAALASRPEIRRLARNTVMLTALAVVHWNDKRLPEQRAELYESIVRWLIDAREDRSGREKAQRCRQLLAELALAMQCDPAGCQVQVSPRWAAERIAARLVGPQGDPRDPDSITRAEGFLAEEEIDSGILVRRGHQLRFWHLTFQEYLAAQALAGLADERRNALLLGPDPAIHRPEWRETVLLLAGVLYLQGADKVDGLVGAVLDGTGADADRAAQARTAGLLGAIVRDLAPFSYRPGDPRYRQTLDAALAVFDPDQALAIPLGDRIAAAEALAQTGDPRLGSTSPERWIEIPAGRFLMGAQRTDEQAPGYDPDAADWESPVHPVRLGIFSIGAFPVTVAEYREFLEDEDSGDPHWWCAGGADQGPEPDDWEEQKVHPSRPVTGVSWYQSMAYCAWLTDRLKAIGGPGGSAPPPDGFAVRLPTETEWEYAARGESGRRHPWGDERPDQQRANCYEARLGAPCPVGVFPHNRTPEGVVDLAGNVWEWCLDAHDEGFYTRCLKGGEQTDPLAIGNAEVQRVLRGGAFGGWAVVLRSAYRGWSSPGNREKDIGFRCVLAAPRQP